MTGDVEVRPAQTVAFTPAQSDTPFYAQEMISTHEHAGAILSFDSGSTLRESENSRVLAELDPARQGAILVTILSGDIEVLTQGPTDHLHFFRDGREIILKPGGAPQPLIPVIKAESETKSSHPSMESAAPTVVTATLPDDALHAGNGNATGSGSPSSASGGGTETPQGPNQADTIGNDDITRQIRMQMSFFQRCYLNYVTRVTLQTTEPISSTPLATSASKPEHQGGTVVMGFTIQNTGRVGSAHIVRSDFADTTLQKCLTEVLERTSFRAFNGDAVTVGEFPISLQ